MKDFEKTEVDLIVKQLGETMLQAFHENITYDFLKSMDTTTQELTTSFESLAKMAESLSDFGAVVRTHSLCDECTKGNNCKVKKKFNDMAYITNCVFYKKNNKEDFNKRLSKKSLKGWQK